ncbi:MAG: hypothetical protein PHQ22_10490 [Sulfuricurvum sp.]|jgi:hypothetical protein|nr:hypothetical protein [Sulfuricurvum sp.]
MIIKAFGVEVEIKNGSNCKYVSQKECHKAHDDLTKYLDSKFANTTQRIDDFMNSVDNYVELLKNKK